MAYWLFQGNPKYYRIVDAIKDFEQMPWLVTHHAKDLAIAVPNITNLKVSAEQWQRVFELRG